MKLTLLSKITLISFLVFSLVRSSCNFSLSSAVSCDNDVIAPLDYGVSPIYECTVTIKDGDGNPVSGVDVNFTVTALDEFDGHEHASRSGKPTGNLNKASQTTDANGQFTIIYGNEVSGKYKITATASREVDGETQTYTESGIITVKVENLYPLVSQDRADGQFFDYHGLRLIGTTTYHPDNHFCANGVCADIRMLGDLWRNKYSPDIIKWACATNYDGTLYYCYEYHGVLGINDISLPWGGLFDCYSPDISSGKCADPANEWRSPHNTHRMGTNVDIASSDMETGSSVNFFDLEGMTSEYAYSNNIAIDVLNEGDHFHLTFTYSPDVQSILGPPYADIVAATDIDIEFNLVNITTEGNYYRYEYELKNNLPSNQDVTLIYLLRSTNEIVGSESPVGWRESPLDDILGWRASAQQYNLAPGQSTTGFHVIGSGIPDIITYQAKGWVEPLYYPEGEAPPLPPDYDPKEDFVFGQTIGPAPIDTSSPLTSLVDRLILLVQTSESNGWIDSSGISTSLWFAKLDKARQDIDDGYPDKAIQNIQAFINEVDAQKGKHINLETWAVLKYNAEYLISQLSL